MFPGRKQVLILCSVVLGCLLGFTDLSSTAAQETYGLGITVANCEQLPTSHPFLGGGCAVAEVYVEVSDLDGNLLGACTTSGVDGGRAGGCTVEVDYGIETVVTLDESDIPDGYYLSSENPQTFQTPNNRPDGEDFGVIFINLLSGDTGTVDDGSETAGVDELPNTGAGQNSALSALSLLAMLSVLFFVTGLFFRSECRGK